ncbi:MAG TPA: Asp-tRNA(Asn)/Glu-tRNA(Gln) amidotransferase subunit GatB [Acidimicrobiales bacterium]
MTLVDTDWELVVGLEVHAELATATKVFCQCPNRFGDEPNTNVCPVCLGLPGSLPVLNQRVVELAIRLGQALHCEVRSSIFHRKNYFYPDMPKDYQISQYDQPINVSGWLELPSGRRIGIVRAHLEEDTGKSTHAGAAAGGRIHGSEYSLVDYNRAGVPLLEIVSAPDIRSVDEAREYVGELRALLVATDVSDAKMEEGSMRVDANVSVRRRGATEFGTRCEIKNLNSVRSLGRAIEYEMRRQIDLLEAGEPVRQETRHWDEGDARTHTLRTKEDADDYRYFPEPDLVPLAPSEEWVAEVRTSLPALPAARRERLATAAGRAPADAAVAVIVERGQDDVAVDAIAAGGDPGRVLVHVEHDLGADDIVAPARLAALTQLEVSGALTATQAKAVLADIVAAGGDDDPAAVAAAKGFEAMDTGALEAAVDAAIAADPTAWGKYVAGDDKVAGAFVGPVMKATKGKADGKAVTALLRARRDAAH